MKYIPLILTLFFTLPLSSQMEFEEVFQIYPDGGYAFYSKVYFKQDSIFIQTSSTHDDIGLKDNYFLSTNDGSSWNNITKTVSKLFPIDELGESLGLFHPTGFYFIRGSFSDTDSSILYINLKGDIIKKVHYPYQSDQSSIKINPYDANFISIHRQIYYQFLDRYSHDLGYSTDMGDTWNFLKPEPELKKQRGIGLISQRKIDFYFSSIEKGKMLLQFQWTQIGDPGYQLTTEFNYLTTQYKFSDYYLNLENLMCFECFEEDYISNINFKDIEINSINLFTKKTLTQKLIDRISYFDKDSIEQVDKNIRLGGFNSNRFSFVKSNTLNINHKVICITIISKDINSIPENSKYLNQIFFQTFDNGENWEFIFNNESVSNQVTDFYINPNNNDLWMVKDSFVTHKFSPLSTNPILFKSKVPLTNIHPQSEIKNLQLHFNKNYLTINSKEEVLTSTIKIYNLTGQLLYTSELNIMPGSNEVMFSQEIREKLILIQISTKNKNNIFKLVRSD